MSRILGVLLSVAALLAPAAAAAQAGLAAPCARTDLPAAARDVCFTVAQAAESAQPQLGILIAGGNPTLGTASTGGLRLGVLPRVSAGLALNVVFVKLPDILAEDAGGAARRLNESVGIPAPALTGTAAVGVFGGLSLAPTVSGIGSVDLLGTATWLPLSAADADGFEDATMAYGGGVKIGVLRESFLTPGVSIALLHRRLGTVEYGDVCATEPPTASGSGDGYAFASGQCAGDGDAGEFSARLSDWSGRATVGKRLLGFGVAAGLGYDRFSSDVAFGFRAPDGATPGDEPYFARASGLEIDASRWSAFVDGSFTALIATVAAEVGWMQGSDSIEGFPSASDFDPGAGTFFGSVGVRLAL